LKAKVVSGETRQAEGAPEWVPVLVLKLEYKSLLLDAAGKAPQFFPVFLP
jgi:hypothetical protein